MTSIVATGVLPIDPLSAQSSLFSTSKDSTSKYLLETRGQFINLGDFYGSDYYLSKIGYDESGDWNRARRLGDAYYEYLLVTRAISDKLGTRFINGLSDKELMKAMLDNSVELQKDLQLTVGVALTPDQVKALKSDVIWYEYEMVNGEQVLVPKVYLSQTTLATIETDGRDRIGGLNLTAITADELRNNGQVIGKGGITYINAGRVYNVTDTNQLAEIRGDKVSITATAGNIENTGGVIKGIESLSLTAQNGDIINSSSKVTSNSYGNSNNNTQHENLLSIGEISSKGTTYIEANNYDSKAGLLGGSTVILDVKESITIGALTLSGEDNSGTGNDNYAVYRSNKNIGGVVSADNLYVSGKNLNIEGSTVAVNENALLNVEKINIESKVDNTYSESKGTDKSTFSSREQHTKSYEEKNVEAQLFVGGSTLTKGDINIIGSTFVTGDDSYLGGNVTSTSRELNSSYYHQEKKTGFVSNFDVSSGGMSAGAGIQKTEDTININQKTQAMSNVVLGHGTVVDGEKLDLTATNFQHGAIVVNSKEVNYGATKNTYDEKTEHKESYVGVSASISSPLLNRIDQAYNGGKAATKGDGTAGLVNGGVAVINSAVGTINGLAGNQRGANNDFYVSANVGLTASHSESKSHTYYEEAVVTTIRGLDGDSSITYNNTDKITYEGTQSYGDKFIYNNVKEIEKKAVELNNSYSSSSSSTSMSGGMAFDTVTARPGGMNASVSGSNSNYDQSGTSYQNGIFVGVDEEYNNVGKMTIDGFEQYGGKVTGNIAELDIKSKQNTSKTDGSSTSYSAGTNMQQIGTAGGMSNIMNNAAKGMNGSIGGSSTTGERNYVDSPSAFVIGEGSDLSIGKVTNTGAVIGTEEKSNGKIKIDEYIGKNINNKDTYNTTGGTISTGGVGVEYQNKEKEGITHNTVVGNVEIGNSSGDKINTDINKIQETTKDKDSGHYNTFVESGVLVLATEKGRKDFKESVDLAGEEVNAMKKVIETTIAYSNKENRESLLAGDNSDPNKEKAGFIDILQTERFQEGIRNAGYIDLSGKSDKEIEKEIEDRYGALFDRFGKEIEVGFYTNSELSSEDPMSGNKSNSAGFVGEDGKIWINKDNVSKDENFSLNNIVGHEGVHVIKGGNSELLAQYGEKRSSDFINEAIDNGKLTLWTTEPVKDWNKGTLTDKEKKDLSKVQDIEEKLRVNNYMESSDKVKVANKVGEILTLTEEQKRNFSSAISSLSNLSNETKNEIILYLERAIGREITESEKVQLYSEMNTIKNETNFVKAFMENNKKLTNYTLTLGDDDFVSYGGNSRGKEIGGKLIKEIVDNGKIVDVIKGGTLPGVSPGKYTEIASNVGSIVGIKGNFEKDYYMNKVGEASINGMNFSIADGTMTEGNSENWYSHELIHSLSTITNTTSDQRGVFAVLKKNSSGNYSEKDIIISRKDSSDPNAIAVIQVPKNATLSQIEQALDIHYASIINSSDTKDSTLKTQYTTFIRKTLALELKSYMDSNRSTINSLSGNNMNLSFSEILIHDKAIEEENTAGVNGRKPEKGINENMIHKENNSPIRGSYPNYNSF